MAFDAEKMAVYRLAREHTRAVRAFLAAARTRGHSGLVRQLRESTASVPANILEAKGEWRSGKQGSYLMIAKGSIMESWAHTDTAVDLGLIDDHAAEYQRVREIQRQIVALLVTMIRRLEADDKESARVS